MSPAQRRQKIRRLLRSSLRGRGSDVRRLAAWSTVQAVPAFLSGLLVARAIDEGFLADRPATGFAWLGVLGVSVLLGAWATRQTYLALAAVVEPFRDELVARTVDGALRRSTAAGALAESAGVARLTQQVEIAREAYASVLLVVQGFVVTTVGAILGLLTLVPVVLVFVVPPLVVALGLFFAALPGMAARQRASILADEQIAATAGTVVAGLRDVVACGGEDRARTMVGQHVDAHAGAIRELARFTAVRTIAVAIGGWLPIVLILVAGSWLLRHGASTGALLGALTYVSQGVHAALQTLVRGLGNTGLWLFVSLARIVEETETREPTRTPPVRAAGAPRRSGLELRGVTFGYGGRAEPVIRHLDLSVPAGDHLAIVGPSGGGKSTLAGLMAGLLRPEAGVVLLGGVPVTALDARVLAGHRALVPQEAYVFAATVGENLRYLRPDAGAEEVDRVVELLGMRSLVDRLGGYGAELDARELSAGERQLITLARAYLSPAPIVILDEAACYLDARAEARIERAFADRGGTLIVIAHRISSALRARRVLVMDGTDVALGSHEELLERSPLYRELVGFWSGDGSRRGAHAPRPGRRRGVAEPLRRLARRARRACTAARR